MKNYLYNWLGPGKNEMTNEGCSNLDKTNVAN